jgi:DNA-directed RNA polymerase subunit K/omega
MKKMQKTIVMSAAYRQSSKVTPALLEKDPDNRLLARGPRFRLSGEVVRDQALAVSGLLVNKVGGRFKLSTLIQKRLVALNAGARPLVEVHTNDKMQIVIAEIINDKISLDTSGNLRITGASDAAGDE